MTPRKRAARPRLRTLLAVLPVLVLGGVVVVVVWIARRPVSNQPPIKPGSKQTTTPTDEGPPLPFEAMASVLVVRCSPEGGKVYLNGACKGRAPVQLNWRVTTSVAPTFQLEVRADGYLPYREEIELHPGEWRTVQAKLSAGTVATPSGAGAERVVCIDPGHPSEVSDGASASDGTTENHMNWVVAQKLRTGLEASGLRVVMTKQSEDEFVTNQERAEIANAANAAIMVRLHCDSGASSNRGFAVYYPDRPGRKGEVTGPSQTVCEASGRAAQALHEGLAQALRGSVPGNGVRKDVQTAVGSDQGALTGSIFSKVPVVTVEMVFLSNPEDVAFIKSEEGQQRMALGLADGIARFVQ